MLRNQMATFTAAERKALAKSGAAMEDGGFPIENRAQLQDAIQTIGRAKDREAAMAHIKKRARALGLTDLLPDEWQQGMGQEAEFATVLILEGSLGADLIQERPTADNGGVMRMRVPFYVGEAIARAPGISKPIYFPKELLPSIVQEGKRRIAEAKQPITSFARHSHAASGDHLPIGAVVDLEHDGRVGYAIIEVSPTSDGKDVQILAENKHINAVSLRSGRGSFEFKSVLVNETPMFQPTRLHLDGIDFAPEGPAQPTYGLEILQEAARVATQHPNARRSNPVLDLTLEALKADHPTLIAEIEAPLRKELETERAAKNALLAEKATAAREAALRQIAARFPDPDKAFPLLLEVCKDCETDDQVKARAFDLLGEVLVQQKSEDEKPENRLLALFKPGGRGQSLKQEKTDDGTLDPRELGDIALAEV